MTEHFPDYELECNCGCGLMNMKVETLSKLEVARKMADIPFGINSGSRCSIHNKHEGGDDTSSHLSGYAVDIAVTSSKARFAIIQSLIFVGFTRLGIGHNFIHVDDDPSKAHEVSWVY